MIDANIVLVGFMGTGKSLVSRQLGNKLKRNVYSTDAIIEKQTGKTINVIFQEQGEANFRRLERDVVKQLVNIKKAVIDCGGGVQAIAAELSSGLQSHSL